MKEIRSRQGYYLTQSAEVDDRIFATAIKGANVDELDWREATEEEKSSYERLQENV